MNKIFLNQEKPTSHELTAKAVFKKIALLFGSAITIGTIIAVPLAHANTYDQQINQLNAQNAQINQSRQALEDQEDSLAAVIASLRAQIAELENQIRANETKREELRLRIIELEAEIVRQREVLKINIKTMYLEGDISTMEMLASSRDMGEYVDREQYRIEVSGKIKTTLDRINALKAEVETQKATIEKLLGDQQVMQGELNAQRAETARLLALNQQQQAEYDNSIRSNKSRIAELRRQQAAENARNFVGQVRTSGNGSYPWANVPFPNTISDPWGMYKRQCVSYTAWKVASTGRHMPYWGGRGNAKNWDDNARAAGIPVDYSPRVGDVAVSNAGTYGHVMYVEAVHGDGTISISQYNAGWDGRYSEGRRSTAGLVFIHF